MRGAFPQPAHSVKLATRSFLPRMLEPTPLYGGNADFLDALYEQYLRDPASVDARWRGYFERLAAGSPADTPHGPIQSAIVQRAKGPRTAASAAAAAAPGPAGGADSAGAAKQAAVSRLIQIWIRRDRKSTRLN